MFFELLGIASLGASSRRYLQKKKPIQRLLGQPRRLPVVRNGVREQQLRELATDTDTLNGHSKPRQLADRNMAISVSSLALATAGKLIAYPPLAVLSLPGILYVTHFAVVQTWDQLRQKKLTVDALSVITKVFLLANGYLVLAGLSVCLFSVNRKLLNKISDDSKRSITDVFKQQPGSVWVVCDGLEREIPLADLKIGDAVVVAAGNPVPVDGVVISGSAIIDQHVLTGESQPVEKHPGDTVFALTVVLSGSIQVQTLNAGQDTTAAQIANVLNRTIHTKTDVQLRSQAISDRTVLPTLILSGLSLPVLGPVGSIAIINSHFKYRTTIAANIGALQYLNRASASGILVKDGHTFDMLRKVDTIIFDKTGTLTDEQPKVVNVYACDNYSQQDVLRFAAAAEVRQHHPIAKAILHEAREQQLDLPAMGAIVYKLGYGLTAEVAGQTVRVGSLRFLEEEAIPVPASMQGIQAKGHDGGSPVIMVALDDTVIGSIELATNIRPGTQELIHQLRDRGIKNMCIISGDHPAPTRKLAQDLGIESYFAETLPTQKAALIAQFQAEGKTVCYVGDGINDAIALQQADVSVSIRGASSVATDAAQIILMDKTLRQLPYLFDMGQQFNRHLEKVVKIVMLPSIVSASGVLFLHFGLLPSMLLPQMGLLAGVVTALHPRADTPRKK